MNIWIKICGITCSEDALMAEKMGASAVGFVFFDKSPRCISPGDAGKISEVLNPLTARVGVFVDEDRDTVKDIVEAAHLTAVQLHGSEDKEYIDTFKDITVIKALRVTQDFVPELLTRYTVNMYLLDTYSKNAYGGTGESFDWRIARKCADYGRIILAGGLDAANVREAVSVAQPWGIDLSSGVESRPGRKDREKMTALFQVLHGM